MSEQLVWKPPEVGQWNTTDWHRWATECGRYRVMRLVSRLGDDRSRFCFEYRKTVKQHLSGLHTFWDSPVKTKGVDARGKPVPGGYAREFRHLHTALEAAEKFHADRVGEDVESNREEIVALAEKDGLASVRQADQLQYPQQENPMSTATTTKQVTKFERDDVVALCESIGLHMAKKWDAKTMLQKLRGVAKYPVEERTPQTGTLQVLMDSMVEAIEAGDKIELQGFDKKKAVTRPAKAHEGNGKATKATASRAKTPKVEANGKATEKDAYGFRVGSNASRAAATLGKTPKKMEQVTTEAGLEKQVYGDFRKLLEKKLIVRTAEGFSVA